VDLPAGLPSGVVMSMLWYDGAGWTRTIRMLYDGAENTLILDAGQIKPNFMATLNGTTGLTVLSTPNSDDNIANINSERLRVEEGAEYTEIDKTTLKLSGADYSVAMRTCIGDDKKLQWLPGMSKRISANLHIPENIIPTSPNLDLKFRPNTYYSVRIEADLYIDFTNSALTDSIEIFFSNGTVGNTTVTLDNYGAYERYYAPLTGASSRDIDVYQSTHLWTTTLNDNALRTTEGVYRHKFNLTATIATGSTIDDIGFTIYKTGGTGNAIILPGSTIDTQIIG